jgi:hypothetical protein
MKEPKLLDFKIEQSIVQNSENKIIKTIIKPNKNNKNTLLSIFAYSIYV